MIKFLTSNYPWACSSVVERFVDIVEVVQK